MLPPGQSVGPNIDLAGSVHGDEKDVCLIAHRPKVPGYRVQEDGAAAQMVYVGLGYLVVSLNKDYPVAEVLKAGLDRQLDTGELPSIVAHALLRR